MKKCKLCSNKEELYECERCSKEVCLDCCTNAYPISTTICNKCYDKFVDLMEDNNFVY